METLYAQEPQKVMYLSKKELEKVLYELRQKEQESELRKMYSKKQIAEMCY